MVLTVQLLNAKNVVRKQNSLTGIHDVDAAWSGLGSALLTIWRQLSVPSGSWPIAVAAVYLGCIAALHISTPSLFSLETFNTTIPTPLTTYGLRNYSNAQWPNFPDLLSRSFTAHTGSVLRSLDKVNTPGLSVQDGTIHHIIDADKYTPGNMSVPALFFSVSCGYFPKLEVDFRGNDSDRTYELAQVLDPPVKLESGTLTQSSVMTVRGEITPYGIRIGIQEGYALLDSVIIVTPEESAFVDSSRESMSFVDLGDHPMDYYLPLNSNSDTSAPINVTRLQVLGCTLEIDHHTAIVDTQNMVMQELTPSYLKTSSAWEKARGVVERPPMNWTDAEAFVHRYWGRFLGSTGAYTSGTGTFSSIEMYLMSNSIH